MTWHQQMGSFDNPINPEYEQEARLVEQSRAGSERAFSALLARYQQPVFRLIFFLVGDEEEARDLTRVALKHALHRLPRVPSGYSIRPWLLRVASLVALDAVRARSESAEALVASLQLPAPAGPPLMVDADPPRNGEPRLDVALQQLQDDPQSAIDDAWDRLPLDIERELVRRLLATMPESDAEILALGVVGQVPTRELAAMVGTSQRSIRRRIARALIMFQSNFLAVSSIALPPAPAAKELPPAPFTTSPLETARRGINDVAERLRRGIQGVREGFGSVEAQERLQSLRADEVPSANLVGRDVPPNNAAEEATTIIRVTPGETQPVPTVIISAEPVPSASGGPTWGVWSVPEPPDLLPTQEVFVDAAGAETMILAQSALAEAAEAEPPPHEEEADASRPSLALTVPRVLPRYGPPPDDVAAAPADQPSIADVMPADVSDDDEVMSVPAPLNVDEETRVRARVDLPLPSLAAPEPAPTVLKARDPVPDVIMPPPPAAREMSQNAVTLLHAERASGLSPAEAESMDVAEAEILSESALAEAEPIPSLMVMGAEPREETPAPAEEGDDAPSSPVIAGDASPALVIELPEPVATARPALWANLSDLAGLAPVPIFPAFEEANEILLLAPPAEGIVTIAPALTSATALDAALTESSVVDPGDLAGIAPLTETDTALPSTQHEEPSPGSNITPAQTSRTVTRPMPRLDRSVVDPPPEW